MILDLLQQKYGPERRSRVWKVNACYAIQVSLNDCAYVLEEVEIGRCLHLKSSINKMKPHLQFLKQPSLGVELSARTR
jgi:hypothetical protein